MKSFSHRDFLRFVIFTVLAAACVAAQTTALAPQVDSVLPDAHALYLDLHQHPELSSHETRTAAELAGRLRALGYEVTEHIGGAGIFVILKKGAGPTVMFLTQLDALPVEEKARLPFASNNRTHDDN